ncbi:MAG: hypothetical protein ABSE62_03025 [Chthoniobacteraceae bacterium]|jgi:hypothetical protein
MKTGYLLFAIVGLGILARPVSGASEPSGQPPGREIKGDHGHGKAAGAGEKELGASTSKSKEDDRLPEEESLPGPMDITTPIYPLRHKLTLNSILKTQPPQSGRKAGLVQIQSTRNKNAAKDEAIIGKEPDPYIGNGVRVLLPVNIRRKDAGTASIGQLSPFSVKTSTAEIDGEAIARKR